MLLAASLCAGALVAPTRMPLSGLAVPSLGFTRPSGPARPALGGASMMIKLAKSDGWDMEKDFLAAAGLADEEETGADDVPTVSPGLMSQAEPAPRSGTQPWGRWSHEEDDVELELALPEGTRAKELLCEVSREGLMRIERDGAPLLVGRLALPVDRAELEWVVEEQADGSKLLCVEVPLLPIETGKLAASVDCIFDDSLRVNGAPCAAPGLSGVGGRAAS